MATMTKDDLLNIHKVDLSVIEGFWTLNTKKMVVISATDEVVEMVKNDPSLIEGHSLGEPLGLNNGEEIVVVFEGTSKAIALKLEEEGNYDDCHCGNRHNSDVRVYGHVLSW